MKKKGGVLGGCWGGAWGRVSGVDWSESPVRRRCCGTFVVEIALATTELVERKTGFALHKVGWALALT